jgi:RHS repeat-associated protein
VIPHKKQLFGGRRRIVKSWHRFYDPTTGRYISADPIGFFGGDFNLYAYVNNDPVNGVDPGAVDLGGSGFSGSIGGGGGVGIGKATACYYWLSKSQYTGKDCECE